MTVKIIIDDNASPNTPFSVRTAFSVDGKAFEVAGISLNMRMQNMNMGKFDYKPLYDKASGMYVFNPVLLPFCMSGKQEWTGTLKYKYNSNEYDMTFIVNLQ